MLFKLTRSRKQLEPVIVTSACKNVLASDLSIFIVPITITINAKVAGDGMGEKPDEKVGWKDERNAICTNGRRKTSSPGLLQIE